MRSTFIVRIPNLLLLAAILSSCAGPSLPAGLATDGAAIPSSELLPSPTINLPAQASISPTAAPTQPPSADLNPPSATKVPRGKQGSGGQGSGISQNMSYEVPAHAFDVILGRPTANSITLSLLSAADQTLTIHYYAENATPQELSVVLKSKIPQEVLLTNLKPDTRYYYSIQAGEVHSFHTARPPGQTFTFTIQADSHLDSNTNVSVYEQTLANQLADQTDFVIDLGDTFMTDKYKPYTDAAPQYLAQRYLLGQLSESAPLFLVLGNHDGEGAPKGNSGQDISSWSAELRTQLFPNPIPDDFYTGNLSQNPSVGYLQDYYAWEWGDALFVVLDPYWFTPPTKGNTINLWNPTLGSEQYQWLKTTLEASQAKWKFVFIHQLVGTLDKDGRGGVEVAKFHEWGGNNPDGTSGFQEYRPNWEIPIHQLLVANRVTAVFHGHDHLFVTQTLDGIIYQEVPQPGSTRANSTDSAVQYGYRSGVVLGGPGHIRVTVHPDEVKVEYVRSYLPKDEKAGQANGQVDYSYIIK